MGVPPIEMVVFFHGKSEKKTLMNMDEY